MHLNLEVNHRQNVVQTGVGPLLGGLGSLSRRKNNMSRSGSLRREHRCSRQAHRLHRLQGVAHRGYDLASHWLHHWPWAWRTWRGRHVKAYRFVRAVSYRRRFALCEELIRVIFDIRMISWDQAVASQTLTSISNQPRRRK